LALKAGGTQPGLFEQGDAGVIPELYMDNGPNFISWVEAPLLQKLTGSWTVTVD
jgi:hypothetical protein